MPHLKCLRLSPNTIHSISRGISAFLAGFTLLNLLGGTVAPYFDGNFWWIDLLPLPAGLARAILLTSAVLMMAYAFRPAGPSWQRYGIAGAIGILGLFAAWNSIEFFLLLARGQILSNFPVPLSLCILAGLLVIVRNSMRSPAPSPDHPRRRRVLIAGTVMLCCVAFPLAQMLCFGGTDYRRQADAIVVFGARTYANGSPSMALADRVQTACDLYRRGLADKLILSGGPSDGPTHETEAMRRLALQAGVPDSAILCDKQGLNTEATVRNTSRLFHHLGVRRVLAVSHGYHLPRVKLAYRHEGWDVYTVPARETRPLRQMPFLAAREVAALWAYYFRPLRPTVW